MSHRKPLALKPFCEALEQHCRELSYEELVELVLSLGARVRPGDRIDFLEEIGRLFDPASLAVDSDSLVSRIKTFAHEIQARLEAIADGSYWEVYAEEELQHEGRRYGDPFDVPAMTSAHWETLLELLAEADALFADGKLDEASAAYEPILALFDRKNEFHVSLRRIDPAEVEDDQGTTELRETRARYARCVYETTPSEGRIERMLAAMEADVRHPFADMSLSDAYPTFGEMADARRSELPDREAFLHRWKQRLREEAQRSTRAQSLFLEAVELTEGESGLRDTARESGLWQPFAYRYWIGFLRARERWSEAVDAAREALEARARGLELGLGLGLASASASASASGAANTGSDTESTGDATSVRDRRRLVTYAAETLIAAGRVLENDEIVLEGTWTAFKCGRSDSSLVELLRAGEAVGRRESVLDQAIELLASDTERHTSTHARALLIAGRLGDTFAITRSVKSVGWSYSDSAAGLCFAAILAYASGRNTGTVSTIGRLLEEYAEPPQGFIDDQTDEQETGTRSYLIAAVIEGITKAELDEETAVSYLRWAERVGRARVDRIVSEKHRGAYRRAAEVLVALAELYAATDRPQRGCDLLDEYRNRFNRHTAFKREIRDVLSQTNVQGIA